jgi:hypothetical protein
MVLPIKSIVRSIKAVCKKIIVMLSQKRIPYYLNQALPFV